MNLHVKLCAGWGLSPRDLEQAPPASEMLAYTRYVLDAGMRGDLLTLRVALAPCVIGYAEIAARLAARPDACVATNPYRVWIDEYAGAPYQEVAAKARATWTGSPISMLHPRVKPSWSRSSRKRPGSRPTSGKWAGARGCVLNNSLGTAHAGAKANARLTFYLDHSVEADYWIAFLGPRKRSCSRRHCGSFQSFRYFS